MDDEERAKPNQVALSPMAQEGLTTIADIVRGKTKMSDIMPPKKRKSKPKIPMPERHPKLDAAIFFNSHCQDIVEYIERTTIGLIIEGLDAFEETLEDDLEFLEKAIAGLTRVKEAYYAKHSQGEQDS